jgi:hypothetical protein
MEKFISEHSLAVHIMSRIAMSLLSYFFVGIGWWLIASILNINTESLRFLDWVTIAIFTKVLLLNTVKFDE